MIQLPRHGSLRILVFGSGTAAFLAAVRSLGRRGHVVFGAWGDATENEFHASPEARSRYLRGRLSIPLPWDPGWLDELVRTVQTHHIDLIIPGDDASLVAIDQNRELLGQHAVLALPPSGALQLLSDKVRASALARSLGVPVASGWVATRETFRESTFSEAQFPLLVKPQASRLASQLERRQTVRRVDSLAELTTAANELLAHSAQVEIQTFFRGKGVGLALLLHRGQEHLAFEHLRLHEPMEGGGSSYRVGISIDERMHAGARRILQAADFEGIAMVEFKWNMSTGDYVFIEVNPRFWGAMPLAIASGADFPAAWVDVLRGVESVSSAPSVRSGLRSRRITEDLWWLKGNLRARRDDPTLNRVPLQQVFRETSIALLTGRERWDTLVVDDWGPAVAEIQAIFRAIGTAIAKRIRRTLAATFPWRVWRRRELLRRFARAGRILVVCKGNICRSPYLAQLLERHVAVRQGGFLQRPGRSSPLEAVDVAARHGVSLEKHQSFGLLADDIDWADLVLVFDSQCAEAVLRTSPAAANKVFQAGLALIRGPVAVDDPFGHGRAAFDACYVHLDRIAKSLIDARVATDTKVSE